MKREREEREEKGKGEEFIRLEERDGGRKGGSWGGRMSVKGNV